jgi:peptide/nickel transport system substrate-binding protein
MLTCYGTENKVTRTGVAGSLVAREAKMNRISRRRVVAGTAAAAVAAMLRTPSVRAQKEDTQTLRFIAEADLRVFDPIWTTAYITRNHGYLIYDTLFGTDESLQIKPQMVERTVISADNMKYTFTLREGLKWHDGQLVTSEDCVESLKRWGKRDRFGQLLMAHTGKLAPLDGKTFTLELAEPFGAVLDALGKPSSNVPFMMPARVAATSADEQVKEFVGSGPFKLALDQSQPGQEIVYLRNPDYNPRAEAPSGSTGGKRAYLDKVIWQYVPDPWEAAEALASGAADWWQEPPPDFLPKLQQNPDVQTFLTDARGVQGWLRPNWLHPPFNNKKARQALLHMMDQETYLSWAIGHPELYQVCPSVFACGGPYETRIGAAPMVEHDLAKARELVKESGYDGRPVVLLQVTDRPHINAASVVTRRRLEAIGFNVILKPMEWSTYVVARSRKEPPEKGGWNLLLSWFGVSDVINPAVHFAISGAGSRAWYGWPDVPEIEKLVTDWVRAGDEPKRLRIADEVQRVALSEVTYVPWGQWSQLTVLRKNVRDVVKFVAPVFWNVKLA